MSNYRTYKDLGNIPDQNSEKTYKCEVITTRDQKQQILQANKLVLIDIYGDWCHPCKVVEPVFNQMAQKYNNPGKVYLCKEDVDAELSPNCTAVPMFSFYVNGTIVKNIAGGDMKQVEESLLNLIAGTTNEMSMN